MYGVDIIERQPERQPLISFTFDTEVELERTRVLQLIADGNHAEAVERIEGSALRGVDGLVDLLNLINGQDRQIVERGRVQINADQLEHLVNGVWAARVGG